MDGLGIVKSEGLGPLVWIVSPHYKGYEQWGTEKTHHTWAY